MPHAHAQVYGNPTQEHLLPPVPDVRLNDYVLVLAVDDLLIHQDWTVIFIALLHNACAL